NPSFETAGPQGPQGPQTSFTGLYPGPCAAAEWEVFNNTSATTTTELVPTTCPNGGTRMIHVRTVGTNNGISQIWDATSGLPHASFSVRVYVVQGKVGIGIGHLGDTSLTSFTTTTGSWEHVTGTNLANQSPVNNIAIMSSGPGIADFYVDLVSVS
ncbi:MAG TPA: hypothetical protein VG476_07890, partial [Acidimicrobiales bacterium]|nr:hypothetical protein [Acidimicrobiales bacterium]